MTEWVVVLEVVPAAPSDDEDMQRLLWELAEFDPVGMRCDDRYALQLRVLAAQPEEALTTAMARWRVVAAELLLGTATVVRSEVMTRRELELDLEAAHGGDLRRATATATHRDPVVRPERVVPAVMSVLAGDDPEQVAQDAGVHPLQLIRWCDLFVEGGRRRLAGTSWSRLEIDLRFFDVLESE